MPREIIMRHRTPHFTHVFSGDGYSSGYYSYLWSEVLDADAFTAFEETGDAFNKDMADKLKRFIYSAGNSARPGRGLYGLPRTPADRGRASRQTRIVAVVEDACKSWRAGDGPSRRAGREFPRPP